MKIIHHIRYRKIIEEIENLKLSRYTCINIIRKNGAVTYGVAYDYLNKKNKELGWIRAGNQMSAGGWDCCTPLKNIKKIEITAEDSPYFLPKNYRWW